MGRHRLALKLGWLLVGTLVVAMAACGDDDSSSGTESGAAGSGATPPNTAPAAPTDVSITLADNPFGASLSWTAPADTDLFGYVVARADAAITGQPTEGAFVQVGDVLPNGAVVVHVGSDVTALDPGVPIEATSHYAVYAVDAGALYSEPAAAEVTVGFPAQPGVIEVANPNGANPVATITQQAPHTPFTVKAKRDGATLLVEIGVTNETSRILFNPKIVVETGDATVFTDGTVVGGALVAYLGPAGLDSGRSRSRPVHFGAITADPLVIDVRLEQSAAALGLFADEMSIIDFSGARDPDGNAFGAVIPYVFDERISSPEGRLSRGAALSLDGRRLYFGNRYLPRVHALDMGSLSAAYHSPDLSEPQLDEGHTTAPVISPDGASLYVAVNNCCTMSPSPPGGGPAVNQSVDLVKLDATTLEVVGRVNLVADAPPQLRAAKGGVGLSPDGATAVVALSQTTTAVVVNTTTMTVERTADLSAAAVFPRHSVIAPDGATAYVWHGGDFAITSTQLSVIDIATGDSELINGAAAGANGAPRMFGFGPDGLLYIARYAGNPGFAGLSIVDPAQDNLASDFFIDVNLYGMFFDPDGLHVWIIDYDTSPAVLRKLALGDAEEVDTDGDGANGVTPLLLNTASLNFHNMVVTP
jgi:hypothetical protein